MTEPLLDEDEIAVLAHAAAGLTWQESAAALGGSERTVRRRLVSAAEKLGTRGVTNTVAVAVARGLVDPEKPPRKKAITSRTRSGIDVAVVLKALAGGASRREAARATGVAPQTLLNRIRVDAELRRQVEWVQGAVVAAAIEKVLAALRGGSTLQDALTIADVPPAFFNACRSADPAIDEAVNQARDEGLPKRLRWVEPLMAGLRRGMTLQQACKQAGVTSTAVYYQRDRSPVMRAMLDEARGVASRGAGAAGRWRRGARDDVARREHNDQTRDYRRQKTLARFTPEIERTVLESLRAGTPLVEAAALAGMTQQTLFGRGRFDAAWAARLDRALMAGRDPSVKHGTDYTYKVKGCRCPECRGAHARFRS